MTFKSRYEALNYLNEKNDIIGYEVTCWEEAREFWESFCMLYDLGRISERDMNLAEKAINMF